MVIHFHLTQSKHLLPEDEGKEMWEISRENLEYYARSLETLGETIMLQEVQRELFTRDITKKRLATMARDGDLF